MARTRQSNLAKWAMFQRGAEGKGGQIDRRTTSIRRFTPSLNALDAIFDIAGYRDIVLSLVYH